MLASLKEVIDYAEEKQIAIGAFNMLTFECFVAVMDVAEQKKLPVILNHCQLDEKWIPLDYIGPAIVKLAERAGVPVCVNLDHGQDLEYVKRALDMGFTSIMIDGSALPYRQNIALTQSAVELARSYHAGTEAEIGVLGMKEDGMPDAAGPQYTVPEEARAFVDETDVDVLAVAVGTTHGVYKGEPKLDFRRLSEIHDLIRRPVVLHGGSGLTEEMYLKAIACGVRKINYYTYMSRAGLEAVCAAVPRQDFVYYHQIADLATKAMREHVNWVTDIFYKLKY